MSEKDVRVRFAPSPTGPLHMGGVRTALYNYLFAKKNNGKFILRIEDTDQKRYDKEAESYIKNALDWCGLLPDEGPENPGDFGPYKQSERKEIYSNYIDQLIQSGWAYYAFDTSEELEELRKDNQFKYSYQTRHNLANSLSWSTEKVNEWIGAKKPYVIRFKMPENEEVKFTDQVRGEVSVSTENLDDKVLVKADGLPTYHLANIIDDHLMQITHVIRGEEWLPSTPLHILLYKAFDWDAPEFAHLPLILKPDGKGKLSKRDGEKGGFPVFPLNYGTSIGYKESGYFPEAFINMLAMLGWNPGTEQEVFSLKELIDSFSLQRVQKGGARFDIEKAKWFNGQHLKNISVEKILPDLKKMIETAGYNVPHETYLTQVFELMRERLQFLRELLDKAPFFFTEPGEFDEKSVRKKWKEDSAQIVTKLASIFDTLDNWNAEELEKAFKNEVESNQWGFGKAMIGVRLALTGMGSGPSLFEIMVLLGKEKTLFRLKSNAEQINNLKSATAE